MSYQVLARKWRPQNFAELVGQDHVRRALCNALERQRLHHAYLFSGTRGVGKTTIARIFARALNCESGVTATPCGQCSACMEISENRFVDLIEVDAASRTKVEDTRDLLENVQYAPTKGRFKVYLIDEVHMLSNHSFNALLKTLEEPPEHVKFLLATTDPQRLPVTILSRCLQFHLQRLAVEQIRDQLQAILDQEQVQYDVGSLLRIARAADGSMRDALSLLDQAIAFGAGTLRESEVRDMLGGIDQQAVGQLLQALALQDADKLLQHANELANYSVDFAEVLNELLAALHQLALLQIAPKVVDPSLPQLAQFKQLAQQISPEDVQLYYQIALMGQRDLSYSPDPKIGFEMTLIRMLAFTPLLNASPTESLPVPPGAPTPPAAATSRSAVTAPTASTGSTAGQLLRDSLKKKLNP